MKCPKCRFEAASDSYFCPQCGTRIAVPEDGALSATRSMTAPPNLRQPGRVVGNRYKLLNIVGYCEMIVPALTRDPRFGAILDRLRLNANSC